MEEGEPFTTQRIEIIRERLKHLGQMRLVGGIILGSEQRDEYASQANQAQFERDLGASVINEIALYAQRQQASLDKALAVLGLRTNRSANEARRFLQQRQILF